MSVPNVCVIGWPIKHSRSPLIHGFWLQELGLSGSYTKHEVRPEALEDFLRNLSENGFVGCNVTLPHKERVFEIADEKDASACAVSAANTVWLESGKLCVSNTDTEGFMAHLAQSAPDWNKTDAPVLILGAGGAARAIVYGFAAAGVSEIWIANRTKEKSETIAADFAKPGTTLKAINWEDRQSACMNASVIVNTTSIGMNDDGQIGLDLTRQRNQTTVADIVYAPLETGLLRDARQAGHVAVDGLGMLLHQAVPGFQKWFGVRPKVTSDLRDIIVADLEKN